MRIMNEGTLPAKIKLCVVMCSIMKRRLRSLLFALVVTLLLCSRKTEAQRKILVLLYTCEILSLAAELAKNTNRVSIINPYVDLRVYSFVVILLSIHVSFHV